LPPFPPGGFICPDPVQVNSAHPSYLLKTAIETASTATPHKFFSITLNILKTTKVFYGLADISS